MSSNQIRTQTEGYDTGLACAWGYKCTNISTTNVLFSICNKAGQAVIAGP